jgi:hypothetical protein
MRLAGLLIRKRTLTPLPWVGWEGSREERCELKNYLHKKENQLPDERLKSAGTENDEEKAGEFNSGDPESRSTDDF